MQQLTAVWNHRLNNDPEGPTFISNTALRSSDSDSYIRTSQSHSGHTVLRAKEFDLLARLAAEPGVAVGRETLMADVWDENWFGSTKTLDVHVAAVRRRLAAAAAEAGCRVPVVTTLRGYGYRLEAAG